MCEDKYSVVGATKLESSTCCKAVKFSFSSVILCFVGCISFNYVVGCNGCSGKTSSARQKRNEVLCGRQSSSLSNNS